MSLTRTEAIALTKKVMDALNNLMGNLYSRWQDEKQYEDIADYQKVIEKHLPALGIQMVKMTKRPFGFHFKTPDCPNTFYFKLNSREAQCGWFPNTPK